MDFNKITRNDTLNFKIEKAIEEKRILGGKIQNVRANGEIIIALDLAGEYNEVLNVAMPFEESTLYVPKTYKDQEGKLTERGLRNYRSYVGCDISFFLEVVGNELKASMKKAKRATIEQFENNLVQLPFKLKVNVLGARKDYIIVEWNGIVQTVSAKFLSHSEVTDINDFIADNNNLSNEFMLTAFDQERKLITLDRRPLVINKFAKKTGEGKDYQIGDYCMGKVIDKIVNDIEHPILIIELEPELLALAYPAEGFMASKGTIVKGEIKKFNANAKKIILKDVTLV